MILGRDASVNRKYGFVPWLQRFIHENPTIANQAHRKGDIINLCDIAEMKGGCLIF